MAENIKLLKTIEQFITSKSSEKKDKNFSFEINYHSFGQTNLPVVYDNTHYIHCVINNKKEFEELSKLNSDFNLLIKDSKLDLVFYKTENEPKFIKCCVIFIINDFVISNKKSEEDNNLSNFDAEKIININKDNKITKKVKKFLFDYIKKNSNDDKNFSLNKIFLENTNNNIKSFHNDIKIEQFELIKNIDSEIKMKEGKNLDAILDELNPEIKEELIGKYIDEMPDEIVNLQKKYRKINFTNEIYKNYINSINNKEKKEDNK